MNNIQKNCQQESNAKFYYASERMYRESKSIEIATFVISLVPIILSLIPMEGKTTLVFVATLISFTITVVMELLSSFLSMHKEHCVLLRQLYHAGITGSTFSKIEYDREHTNFLNELAIRKAEATISSLKEFYVANVPKGIDDKYAYLYLCRTSSASNNFLMSRMYAFYIVALAIIIAVFISFAFVKHDSFEFLQLVMQFYPLVLPVMKNINACRKSMKYYTKISADIDNYFAGGDKSNEKRARFISYIQGLEFEAMKETPAKYAIFYKAFSGGLKQLERGVINRFFESVELLEGKRIARINPIPLIDDKGKVDDSAVIENKEKIKIKKPSKDKMDNMTLKEDTKAKDGKKRAENITKEKTDTIKKGNTVKGKADKKQTEKKPTTIKPIKK